MKIHSIVSVIVCLALLVSVFTACQPSNDPADTTQPTTPTTTPTTVAIIEEQLEDMLTQGEISEIVGVSMNAPTVTGQGTVLTSVGTDSMAVLNVEVSEKPRDIFDSMLVNYSMLKACPNLGDVAWYSAAYKQLLVYGEGFMITVELIGTDDDDDMLMLRCRGIAAELLEELKG